MVPFATENSTVKNRKCICDCIEPKESKSLFDGYWGCVTLITFVCLFLMIQDFKMTGREFLELDSLQHRLYLERLKRMEVIQKTLNELPKADQ